MGSDELSSLALSINDMSAAVKQSLDAQNELKKQNYDIVTSISHDIRTPLTSVICYLDMLADGKVQNAEKAAGYLKSARQKAYQIKDLTDNLVCPFCIRRTGNFPSHRKT